MPNSFRVEDFSDREFLLILDEVSDADGWASSKDMAERIGAMYPTLHRSVASRLSWLTRYGVTDREHLKDESGMYRYIAGDPHRPKWGQRWRLTDIGRAITRGRLTAAQEKSIANMGTEKTLMLTRMLTELYREQPEEAAIMMRREWRYGTSPLRQINGR